MNGNNNRISARELTFSIICYMICSSLLYGGIAGAIKHDIWIAVIAGLFISVPVFLIFLTLFKRFPGKDIIQINELVFGKIVGKIFSALYIFYFFSLCFVNTEMMGSFVLEIILPETPKAIILIFFMLLCVYAVRKGVAVIARFSSAVFFIAVIALFAAIFLLLNKIDMNYFKPMFSFPTSKYVQTINHVIFASFSNVFVFTMLAPELERPEKLKKPFFISLIVGALFMLGVVGIDVAALGPAEAILTFPSFDVIRIIDIQNIITRMDSVYEIAFLMVFFFKISILLYATTKALSRLLNLNSHRTLVPTISVLVVIFALIYFDSSIEVSTFSADTLPYFKMLFQLILPLLTLIISMIRRKKLSNTKEASK